MGSGFKDFASGAILTAGDVDNYLMRQTVMTFANASARDTALSGVLDEGMVAYLEDTDTVTVYDGSSWNGIGGGVATAFTPSWTNFTPGNATESWYYVVVNDLLIVQGTTTLGSTSVMGSVPQFDFPVGTQVAPSGATVAGRTVLQDTGSDLYLGFIDIAGSKFRFWLDRADATYVKRAYVTPTAPMTWTTNDVLWMTATAIIS